MAVGGQQVTLLGHGDAGKLGQLVAHRVEIVLTQLHHRHPVIGVRRELRVDRFGGGGGIERREQRGERAAEARWARSRVITPTVCHVING